MAPEDSPRTGSAGTPSASRTSSSTATLARPAQQAGEIVQALHVPEVGCLARVGHRPVVALAPEDRTRRGGPATATRRLGSIEAASAATRSPNPVRSSSRQMPSARASSARRRWAGRPLRRGRPTSVSARTGHGSGVIAGAPARCTGPWPAGSAFGHLPPPEHGGHHPKPQRNRPEGHRGHRDRAAVGAGRQQLGSRAARRSSPSRTQAFREAAEGGARARPGQVREVP